MSDAMNKAASQVHEVMASLPKSMGEPFDVRELQKDGWRIVDTGEMVPAEFFDKALTLMGEANIRIIDLRIAIADDGVYKSAQILISPVGIQNLGQEIVRKNSTVH